MLLILREEIICAIILIFLTFYYSINKVKDKGMLFLRISCVGLLHVLLDMTTVITVNNLDTVPRLLNDALHIAFYLSGILFIQQFYNYIAHLCIPHKHFAAARRLGCIPPALFLIVLMFFPMEYVNGSGTNYSFGPLVFIGYGLFALYCSVCMGLLLYRRKSLDKRTRRSLIPMIIAMFTAIAIQAMIPELLMTGAGVTFVCLGLFVALDNPDKDYREQALWDFNTGLKNRNCYNQDIEKLRRKAANHSKSLGIVLADINFLKTTNDKFGHAEGDKLIVAASEALRANLKAATDIYRIGGDEFVALYISPTGQLLFHETENLRAACGQYKSLAVPLSMGIGYSIGAIENFESIFQEADQNMYANKARIKERDLSLPL